MIGYSELGVMFYKKKYRLFHGKKETGIIIKYDGDERGRKDQYRIVFEDGVESEDFYNFTRACDNAKKYYLNVVNKDTEIASGEASGCV